MMEHADINYLTRRAEEEREIANGSADPIAANIHRRLARLYAELAGQGSDRPILRIVVPEFVAR